MKTTLIILLSILWSNSNGQKLEFNNESIDSISVVSHLGIYQFDTNGTTIGNIETLIIIFDSIQSNYIISNHTLKNYTITFKPPNQESNSKRIKKQIGEIISTNKVLNLLEALSKNQKNLDYLNEYKVDEFKQKVNEKSIRKIARKINELWQFRLKYHSKEKLNNIFKACQSLDTFAIYLNENFDFVSYPYVTDYSNNITVLISTLNSNYKFEGKYPNPLKQPWYNHSDNKILNKKVLNLDINIALENILPRKFLLRNSISKDALIDNYIYWFLKRLEI